MVLKKGPYSSNKGFKEKTLGPVVSEDCWDENVLASPTPRQAVPPAATQGAGREGSCSEAPRGGVGVLSL